MGALHLLILMNVPELLMVTIGLLIALRLVVDALLLQTPIPSLVDEPTPAAESESNPESRSSPHLESRELGSLEEFTNLPQLSEIESSPEPKLSPEPQELGPLKEFTCFPELPPELRCIIWKHAANLPRLVSVYILEQLIDRSDDRWAVEGKIITIALRDCPQPTVLQVCHEGRKECLPLFQIIEGRQLVKFRQVPEFLNRHETSRQPRLYVNPAVDTMFLRLSILNCPPL